MPAKRNSVGSLRKQLNRLVDFAYEQGYHELGIPIVEEFEQAVREAEQDTPARLPRLLAPREHEFNPDVESFPGLLK